MKASRSLAALPSAVARDLRKLGHDLSVARRRRRLPMKVVAERSMIARATLARVERGEPGVSLGIYATVLFVLGMAGRLGRLADSGTDATGLSLEDEHLPKRIRSPRRRAGS